MLFNQGFQNSQTYAWSFESISFLVRRIDLIFFLKPFQAFYFETEALLEL